MDKQEIIEGNRLIAEFMGYNLSEEYAHQTLKYHSDWNWLMEVVNKVEAIYDEFHGYFGVHIHSNACTIQGTKLRTDPENLHPAYLSDPNAILETKLESTYYNIVQFIQWYSEHEK